MESNTIDIISEHCRLAREFSELPVNADSQEAYEPIQHRRDEITKRIIDLQKIERSWEHAKA